MHLKVGRVTPCAPLASLPNPGAHGGRPAPCCFGRRDAARTRSRDGCATRPFHRFALAVLFCVVLLPGLLPAQTNAPVNIADRYLFIVDTSAAMRRRAPAVQKAIENLLRSSMAAQFQRGDTVGVWTFNEQLYAGRLPLQTWAPETSDLVTSNVVHFLQAQTYTGASRFESVAPTLRRIVEESPRLTILLVSDGDEQISGTPFDADIRRALASKSREQEKARMPFVTVLRAARGRIASATVNLAPWPVEFPKFPPEPKVVEAPKPETKSKPESARSAVPSLIVVGNKKKEPAVVTNAVPTAAANASTPSTATPVGPERQAATPMTPVTPVQPHLSATAAPTTTDSPTASPPVQPVTTKITPDEPAPTPVATTTVVPPRVEPAPPSTAVPEPIAGETPAAVAPAIPDEPATSSTEANPPAEVAVAMASDPGNLTWLLIVAGTVPIVLGVGVFFYLQKRARNSGHGSLITRALDRDRK